MQAANSSQPANHGPWTPSPRHDDDADNGTPNLGRHADDDIMTT